MKEYRNYFFALVMFMQIYGAIAQNEPFLKDKSILETELNFGNVNHFSAGQAAFMCVETLSENEIIVAYRDWENQGYGTVVVGSVSYLETAYGEPVVFASANIYLPKIKMVNDSVFLIVYRDMDLDGKGMLVKGELNNGNIQFEAPIIFSNSMISTSSLIVMNDTTFLIAYKDNSNGFGTLLPGKFVNGSVSLGELQIFNAATSFENVLCRMTDTTFVITYRDAGNGESGTIKTGTIQNEQITLSEPVIFSSSATTEIALAAINSTDFVITYLSGGAMGESIMGKLAGNSVVFTNSWVYCGNAVSGNAVVSLSDSIAVVSYADIGNNNYGTSKIMHIRNDGLIYGDAVIYIEGGAFTTQGSVLSDSTFVLVFRNERNNFSGSSICGKITTDQTIGVEYNTTIHDIAIYPNPTMGFVTVEGSGINKIVVLNMSGQTIETIQPSENETNIDLTHFEKGFYLIKAVWDNQTVIRKVVLE
ncbi:MAG: hypothetical protein COW63_05655 [Bacteroidetes bacterium CG18_big_fil_WC_8_21_14_2_50_41_14]|nr:MAG: hypothetical protein COW63_05655 [Bacteroidetes bacterium CG18_big_fil_WC_8_21_14_2_50_41_14]